MAQKNLTKSTNALNTSIERLTTGLKVNKAADDAAGLAIATSMNTQIRGSQVAQSNIQQGINVLETGEGVLSGISENVDRIRDLAVQASNGFISSDSLDAIKSEVVQRVTEINKAANSADFNGVKLFDGTGAIATSGLRLQVGANADADTNSITVENVFTEATVSGLNLFGGTGTYADVDTAFADATSAAAFLADCDTALTDIATRKSNIGAYQNRLQSNNDSLDVTISNLSASKSTIMDTDTAKEAANLTKSQILQQISASLLTQANQTPSIALSLI